MILVLFCLFATTKYHFRFNETRKFHELNYVNFKLTSEAKEIDDKLVGLKWITPEFKDNSLSEIILIKEIYIDLSWLSTKFSGGAFYSVTNIIKCIFENKKILKNYKIFIIARKKFFTENKLPNKVKKISISNIYYFNFYIDQLYLELF